MNLDEVVELVDNESVAVRCRRLVAAVITQGFLYMVRAGVEYGEVYTGEATIFLRIPEDASTVYYSLSVPKGDVGPSTAWNEDGNQPNRLHLAAVAQAVAFTLRAIQTRPRGAQWRTRALNQLKTWNAVVKEIEDTIVDDEVPSSEYRPSPGDSPGIKRTPIQFRKKRKEVETCPSVTSSTSSDDDDHHPDTPSRPPPPSNGRNLQVSTNRPSQTGKRGGKNESYSRDHRQKNLGRFCTPSCLLGIIRGGELDQQCPNVKEHGKSRFHHLNDVTFMRHIRRVFRDQLDYCEDMNIHGARGALFKVKLPGFGYTVVAKGTGIERVRDLMHESAIYRRLLPVQGKYVPVHLGELEVECQLYYAGAVRIVYMMFLSFSGFPLRSPIPPILANEAIRGLRAIHMLGVLQKDPAIRNILVHPDRPGITWIDFERAEFVSPRVVLGNVSPNRRRKPSQSLDVLECDYENSSEASREIGKAKAELAKLVVSQTGGGICRS